MGSVKKVISKWDSAAVGSRPKWDIAAQRHSHSPPPPPASEQSRRHAVAARRRMRTNGDPKLGTQKTPRAGRNRRTNFFIVKFPTHGLLWHRSNDASRTMPAREEGEAAMTVARSAPSSHSWHERDDGAERVILICDGLWVRDAF